MRYKDTGNVHMDFHRTMNGTISYLREHYGVEFLDNILRQTAHDVYAAIRKDLMAGNPEHLVEHWTHYLDREKGEYRVVRENDAISVIVERCPAASYLKESNIELDPSFRRQTTVLNEALAEDTPFEISTEVIDDTRYIQTIRRRHA